jgi:hypothetical protein
VTLQPDAVGGDDRLPRQAAAAGPPGRTVRWRRVLALAALVLGLCGLAASAAGVANQLLPRRFTPAQQRQIMGWETARRWRAERAGRIFPAVVRYQLLGAAVNSPRGLVLTARRVGIARQEPCVRAADRAAAPVLSRLGCRALLRATYVDATGSMLTTVGVAIMPSSAAATHAADDLSVPRAARGPAGLAPGVRPAGYPRTLAADFGNRQRQFSTAASAGPYLIMSAAGFADDRPWVPIRSDRYTADEMSSFAVGLATAIGSPLSAAAPVPRCPGSPGC